MSWALQRPLRCSRPLKRALNLYLRISVRNFSELGPNDSVELTYIPTIPHNGNTTDNPLVILHGLLSVSTFFRRERRRIFSIHVS